MNYIERKRMATLILNKTNLLDTLSEIGDICMVGSYVLDTMAWNDIDIYIENSAMSMDELYRMTEYIIRTYNPIWYEAKEEKDKNGNKTWFHGFETMFYDERWNFDLWFLSAESIRETQSYSDEISKGIDNSGSIKESIVNLKSDLIDSGLYGHDKFTARDVYEAVLKNNILTADEFLEEHIRGK